MAKSAPAKRKSVTSVRSRAAKRASSPSIDTDKSLKEIKAPVEQKKPSVLAIHQGAGVTKKSKHGRKAVLSAKAKRRQESAMDRAEAVMDKKFTKVEKSKDRARTIQARSKAWEEQNLKMLAKKELEAAMALQQEDWEDESGDDDEQADAAVPNAVGDVQMGAASFVSATFSLAAAAVEEDSDEEL